MVSWKREKQTDLVSAYKIQMEAGEATDKPEENEGINY